MHLLDKTNFELIRHDVVEPILLEVDQVYHLACPASPIHYKYAQQRRLPACASHAVPTSSSKRWLRACWLRVSAWSSATKTASMPKRTRAAVPAQRRCLLTCHFELQCGHGCYVPTCMSKPACMLHHCDMVRNISVAVLLLVCGPVLQVQPHQDHQDQLPGHHEHVGPGQAHTRALPHHLHQ